MESCAAKACSLVSGVPILLAWDAQSAQSVRGGRSRPRRRMYARNSRGARTHGTRRRMGVRVHARTSTSMELPLLRLHQSIINYPEMPDKAWIRMVAPSQVITTRQIMPQMMPTLIWKIARFHRKVTRTMTKHRLPTAPVVLLSEKLLQMKRTIYGRILNSTDCGEAYVNSIANIEFY